MARTPGGTVHIGKAAAIIVAAVLIGVLVLYQNDSGGGGLSAAEIAAARANAQNGFTTTTLGDEQDLTTTTIGARAPQTVKVIAVNATSQSGIAGRATTRLTTAGYNALAPGNATAAYKASSPTTVVYVVTAGYEREAAAVAALFSLPSSAVKSLPTPSPSTDIKDVNVAVVIGSGLTI
jgi:hypothetical protein